MKTNFLKSLFPIAFIAFGLIGAFASNVMEKKSAESGSTLGYIKISATTCQVTSATCDEIHELLCKTPDNKQVYNLLAPNVCPDMKWRSRE